MQELQHSDMRMQSMKPPDLQQRLAQKCHRNISESLKEIMKQQREN